MYCNNCWNKSVNRLNFFWLFVAMPMFRCVCVCVCLCITFSLAFVYLFFSRNPLTQPLITYVKYSVRFFSSSSPAMQRMFVLVFYYSMRFPLELFILRRFVHSFFPLFFLYNYNYYYYLSSLNCFRSELGVISNVP